MAARPSYLFLVLLLLIVVKHRTVFVTSTQNVAQQQQAQENEANILSSASSVNSVLDNQAHRVILAPAASSQPVPSNYVKLSNNSTPISSLRRRLNQLSSIRESEYFARLNNNGASPSQLVSSTAGRLQPQHQRLHQTQLINKQLLVAQLNQPQQAPKKARLLEKICIGTSNRLACPHNTSDHYQNLVERYKDCTYVIGNLEISYLDEPELDLSFLESIREITGYLLIAHVNVERIRMPNLQIIRGRDLFKLDEIHGNKEEFALILIENELKTLELANLREILAGSFGSYNNRNLCHLLSIHFDEILNWAYRSVFVFNGTQPECPPCDDACQGSCWAEGPEMCQKFSKKSCAVQCNLGRCFGPSATECCHPYCAGGCTGPRQSDCLACKNFYNDGECIDECPPMRRYNPNKFSWEPNPNGKYAFGATCVKECPEHLLRDNGACVRTCPPDKRSSNGECVPCLTDPCQKNCTGVEIVHSGNINQLVNCTVIEGSITILNTSFTGYTEMHTNGSVGPRYRPMHPSELETLNTIREITGLLNIQASHPDFKNLNFLRNLNLIGGRQSTTDYLYSLSIVKTSLVSLNLRSLRKVRSGRVLIEENRDLCFADTIDWQQLNITKREDITTRSNADSYKCYQRQLKCNDQCAQDGCWGPGQDECLSCNNHKVGDYCVENCTATQSLGFLSFDAGGRTCRRCHPECRGGCNGTEASHCWQCKSVKDGPYCVSECPDLKYNKNGICEDCDRSCKSGCSGPSNRLGEGGCNSCDKAIIVSVDPVLVAHCMRAEETCPDGYYQEYVSPQADGLLKRLSGKPVCRKCSHKCKSCTGVGTHVSVCECAKFRVGEQCEDFCPRDYYSDEQGRQCNRCSPECNGCFGPTDADCFSCRVYRIYQDSLDNSARPASAADSSGSSKQRSFNCTAQCPPDKPHRISEKNMLDPFCSDDPGTDADSPRIVATSWASIFFTLILLAAIFFCVSVHRCQLERDKTEKLTRQLSGIDDVEPLSPSNMKPNLAPLRSIKETELRRGPERGRGVGGTVYEGYWFPEDQKLAESLRCKAIPVAIKELHENGRNMNKEFLDEAYIMASVRHPNLVKLLAVCMTPNHFMLVTQLMPLGCLLDYVKVNRNKIGSKNLLEWSKQIATGMSYLEERRLVHRDLALRNVLLQSWNKAMISDFGLAKFLELGQSEYHSGGGRLPIKWLAPECIRERKFTHKSDVWAFGVTVWELVTFGAPPFEEYQTKDVPMAIEKGARLQQPRNVSAEVYKVIYACWFYNPEDRPNFKTLVQNFKSFARDPQRYLICGSKGIEYELKAHEIMASTSDMGEDEVDDGGLYGSEDDSFNEEEAAATERNIAAIPDLTPSTHNRLNEIFGFELREGQPETGHRQKHLSSSSSPSCKKNLRQPQNGDDDVFTRQKTDINNNNNNNSPSILVSNNHIDRFWSMQHTISTTSLGQKSEQPTDVYDYLLPSPCTMEHGQSLNTFPHPIAHYEHKRLHVRPSTLSISHRHPNQSRQPPHSAGLINNVTNDEYFMNFEARANAPASYRPIGPEEEEEEEEVDSGNDAGQSSLGRSTSSGNIPHSLV